MKTYKIVYQKNRSLKTVIIKSENIEKEILPKNIISKEEVLVKRRRYIKRLCSSEVFTLFNELNIMLQANILFSDAVEILYNNSKKAQEKEILFTLLHALKNGKKLDVELALYKKTLGELPLVFLKIAQDNGNLKTIMNSLVTVLKSKELSKEILVSSLRYPFILTLSLLFLTLFSFYFVIPKFEHLFLQYNSNLPLATKWLLIFKEFMHNYFLYLVSFLTVAIFFISLKYKQSRAFAYKIDKFLVSYVPLLSKVILFNHFQLFFLSITILLNDKYKFQTAFNNSCVLVNNCYVKQKLRGINQQIQSGKTILFAFEKAKLFDDLVLRLISVGEISNSLNITINEVEKIYKKRVDDSFKSFAAYIEPIFFLLISTFIVWLMLAIFMPIWNLSDAMNM